MKTVAIKDMKTGGFTMCRLTGFGSISSDDRADYTSENKFTEYKNLADGKFGTKVSLGNVKTSLDLKESRLVTLEDDKVVKDAKIADLESDKHDKDSRVTALETDKTDKDTKMSTMESDMTALTNRVTALETLGIKGISNAVSWTNITEINLSGEKLVNGDFDSLTKTYFTGTPTIGMKVDILREALTNSFSWASPSKNPFSVTNVSSTGINVEASDGTSGFLENQHRAGANSNPFLANFYIRTN